MQPTTLNKIVSLFLVGGICALGIAVISWRHSGPFVPSRELKEVLTLAGGNTLAVIGGLLVISVAAVCGAACEALTDIMVRPLLKRVAKSKKWCVRFGQYSTWKYHRYWRIEFRRALSSHGTYRMFPYNKNIQGLAVGILYGSRQVESITWAESHYATYIMSSNLVLLSGMLFVYVCSLAVVGWCTLVSGAMGMLAAIGLFSAFFALSLDRYLYTYQVAMRQSVVTLLQNQAAEGRASDAKAHNTAAQPDGQRTDVRRPRG